MARALGQDAVLPGDITARLRWHPSGAFRLSGVRGRRDRVSTLERWRALQRQHEDAADRLVAAGRVDEAVAEALQGDAYRRAADALEAKGLPRTETSRTVVPMDVDARELKIGRAMAGDHPFPRALHKRSMTVGEWAEKVGISREKVSSWWKAGPGGRRIPREWADRIRDEFGVPLSAWRNGVK